MRAQDKAGLKDTGLKDHTTCKEMVRDLLELVPYEKSDVLLDAGSGKDKVWFNAFDCALKLEYEISEGRDFLTHNENPDWTIGNPPYNINRLLDSSS